MKDEEIVKDEESVVSAAEQVMPDADKWSSGGSSASTASPTADWSDAGSDSSGSTSSSRSSSSEPVHECRDTHTTRNQRDKDIGDEILETILDGLEHGKIQECSSSAEALAARREDLAKLAFHWTNVENFAGIRRADPVPP